jgi:MoxR-like ATPase
MNESVVQWKTWLENITSDQQAALYEALGGDLSKLPPVKNNNVIVTRTPTSDLIVEQEPLYIDIFHLHDIYRQLAFRSNILVKGPKGDGKSLSVLAYAHQTKCPVVIQECSEDVKKFDLMGTQTLLGDDTIFTLGAIPLSIDVANEVGQCILLLEEVNSLTPQVQKMLNAVTDFRKQCSMPFLGRTYKLRPGAKLCVMGTLNPSVYGGTYDLNEDLKSRFEEIELSYPAPGQEKRVLLSSCKNLIGTKMPFALRIMDGAAVKEHWTLDDVVLDRLIRLAGETRQQATGYALSTRDLVRIVETVAILGIEKALQLVLCKFEGEEDKATMKKRISSIFGPVNIENYWT